MKKKVIIIPVFNQLSHLIKCINSILNNTENFEIIIVDDGSTDKKTIDWIQNSGFNIIRHMKSCGFSIACNDGIDYAMKKFDFNCLCLLNSDTEIITKNWFDKVEINYISDDKIGISGVVSNKAVYQTIENVNEYLEVIDNKPTLSCNLIHGFCYFISKKLIMKIGRFDNYTFPHYGSEDDYSLKSIKNGFKNIIVGSVFVKHKGSISYTEELREKIIKNTIPELKERWGENYIKECLEQSLSIKNILNSFEFNIFYSIPYDINKNIGRYYNNFMRILPNDNDFACFVDGDTIFTTFDYGHIINEVIKNNKNIGCFTATTNRVYAKWQIADGVDTNNNDINYHRNFGESIKNKYGMLCEDVTDNQDVLMSGFFILINKKTWKKIGGFIENGILGVDNDLHKRLQNNGEKLYMMKGVYLYHWYRWPNRLNMEHLK